MQRFLKCTTLVVGLVLGAVAPVAVARTFDHSGQASGISYQQAQRIAEQGYQAILERAAEPAGLSNATDLIYREGYAGIIRWTAWLAGTEEFTRYVAPQHAPQEIVATVYAVFLGREPTAYESEQWCQNLESTGNASVVMDALARSPEFYDTVVRGF